MGKVTVDVDIDIDDFVNDNKEKIIESLEFFNCYVFEHSTLADRYKLDWFRDNWQNISMEQLESLVNTFNV